MGDVGVPQQIRSQSAMKIYLLRQKSTGILVARAGGTQDPDDECVCKIDVTNIGRPTSDNPILQRKILQAFQEGVNWGRIYKDKLLH